MGHKHNDAISLLQIWLQYNIAKIVLKILIEKHHNGHTLPANTRVIENFELKTELKYPLA